MTFSSAEAYRPTVVGRREGWLPPLTVARALLQLTEFTVTCYGYSGAFRPVLYSARLLTYVAAASQLDVAKGHASKAIHTPSKPHTQLSKSYSNCEDRLYRFHALWEIMNEVRKVLPTMADEIMSNIGLELSLFLSRVSQASLATINPALGHYPTCAGRAAALLQSL